MWFDGTLRPHERISSRRAGPQWLRRQRNREPGWKGKGGALGVSVQRIRHHQQRVQRSHIRQVPLQLWRGQGRWWVRARAGGCVCCAASLGAAAGAAGGAPEVLGTALEMSSLSALTRLGNSWPSPRACIPTAGALPQCCTKSSYRPSPRGSNVSMPCVQSEASEGQVPQGGFPR